MALDVQTSLANALFAQERAASTKARKNSASPQDFDVLMGEKAVASSASRSHGAMPRLLIGQPRPDVSPERRPADDKRAKPDVSPERRPDDEKLAKPDVSPERKPDDEKLAKPDVSPERKPDDEKLAKPDVSPEREPGDEKLAKPDVSPERVPGDEKLARPDVSPDVETVKGNVAQEGESGSTVGADASQQGTAQEHGAEAVVTAQATPTLPVPQVALVIGAPAPAGTVAAEGNVLTAQSDTALTVGGVAKDGSAATPVVGITSAEGGDAAPVPASVPGEAVNAKATPAKAITPQIGSPQNLDLQAGMIQHGEANAARIAEAASEGALTKDGKVAKGAGEGALESKFGTAQPGESPTLRGSVFTQVLSDFAGEHGFSRNHDFLSALERPVAAMAQTNRGADVQRPTPLQMLPIEIGMQAVRGAREFQIRLDPAELGRVDVKLQINDKGEVNANLVVERPETLQMLRRDATTLAQAFEQAGLKQGENSLSFSLKGENQQGQQQQSGRNTSLQDSEDAALQAQIGEIAMRRVMIPNSSLDRMV